MIYITNKTGLKPSHLRPLVFFDCETFGWRGPIIEVAAIKRIPQSGNWKTGHYREEVYESKIAVSDYEVEHADPRALEITGFNRTEWINAPPAVSVMRNLYSFIVGCAFVAHNAEQDHGWLAEELRRTRVAPFGLEVAMDAAEIPLATKWVFPVICTRYLCQLKYPDWPNHKLETACERFALELEGEHRAMGGARRCAQVWDRLMSAS